MLLFLLPLAVLVAGAAAPAPSAPAKQKRYALRYVFRSDHAAGQAAAAGWNLIDVSSKERADALPGGARALMWLGDYDNKTCNWEISNDDLARRLAGTKDDPKVAGFLFS